MGWRVWGVTLGSAVLAWSTGGMSFVLTIAVDVQRGLEGSYGVAWYLHLVATALLSMGTLIQAVLYTRRLREWRRQETQEPTMMTPTIPATPVLFADPQQGEQLLHGGSHWNEEVTSWYGVESQFVAGQAGWCRSVKS